MKDFEDSDGCPDAERDVDRDGIADTRDDCPNEAGDSIRDLQGCPDNNGDGWSNEYGTFKSAIAIMGEDPAASWLTYLIIGLGFILGASLALVVKMGREEDDLNKQEKMFNEKEHVDFSANLPPEENDITQDSLQDGGEIVD